MRRLAAWAAALGLWAGRAGAQSTAPVAGAWSTDGTVYAIAQSGNTTYIGGSFAYVGVYTGAGAILDMTSGSAVASLPITGGGPVIYAAAADGSGGYYIGGYFTTVGGVTRNNAAHILSDGTVDPSWNPSANNNVRTLLVSGTTVYAGGYFTTIGGQARNYFAALDATTGNATAWNPNADSVVWSLAVSANASTIYAGGAFANIGGQARNNIAALDATTGNATSWNPNGTGGVVDALLLNGSTVYAGGTFANIGGQARNYIAAIDSTTGNATGWNPNANNFVNALTMSGSNVFAGGYFTNIGGQARNSIAALDATSGNATAWNPSATGGISPGVYALAVSGSNVYASGNFTSVGGQTRNGLAALDATTGNASTWNPNPNARPTFALAISGTKVYAGGQYTMIGGVNRSNIAALDLNTGQATSWNPNSNGQVNALAVNGSNVYAGGGFTNIGGQARNYIAALDATSGNATTWNPSADASLLALAVSGSNIYAGGNFGNIGGQARSRIAALDATSGNATAWNPNANLTVLALTISGSSIYAGGNFTNIGGQTRNYLAALDAGTGNATAWNPNASGSGSVTALLLRGSMLYVGGSFTNIGGQYHFRIAALDTGTGNATAWPVVGSGNQVLALSSGWINIYAGGSFTNIADRLSANGIAALDPGTGYTTAWNPNFTGGTVYALSASTSFVYVGGSFTSGSHQNFAQYAFSVPAYDAVSVASQTATLSGHIVYSTVTLTVTSAGTPVAGVPIQLASLQASQTPTSPGVLSVAYSNLQGQATFMHMLDLSAIPHAAYSNLTSTLTFTDNIFAGSYPINVRDMRASTFTVTVSTPSIEDDGTNIVQVTTVTITVKNSVGAAVANYPVAVDPVYSGGWSSFAGTPSAGTLDSSGTNSSGKAIYAIRVPFFGMGTNYPIAAFTTAQATYSVFGMNIAVSTINAKLEPRASTFTVTISTPILQADVKAATMTITVYDVNGSTVPNAVIALNQVPGLTALNGPPFPSGYFTPHFKNYSEDIVNAGGFAAYTDSFGQAKLVINTDYHGNKFDDFNDTIASVPIFALNVVPSTPTYLVESDYLDHYSIAVPTITTVGISFTSTITAVNKYNHQLYGYYESGVNLVPLLANTNIQGSGTLGTSQVTFLNTSGQVFIAGQNYNRVETIQVKAVRSNNATTGLSSSMTVIGPDHFNVSIPTAAQAGVAFPLTITAVDASNNQISGYVATLALSPLQSGNTAQAGAGSLGQSAVNMPANGVVTINETYTKSEGIKIRVSDAAGGVTGYSSSATITAGLPAVLSLSANPQSTIAAVPSVLTATVQDLYANPVASTTVTISVVTGSGAVGLSQAALASNLTTTNTVTNALGQATAFFGSTNTTSAEADLLQSSIGSLTTATTIYNAVLITPAGGIASNLANPSIRVTVPVSAFGFNVRMTVESPSDLSASDFSLSTSAFAKSPNSCVSSSTIKIIAVKDSSPSALAGTASRLVTVEIPYTAAGGLVSVGAYRPRNLLVPLSVMRVFKLNNANSVFNMLLDGTNLPNTSSGTIAAQVSDPTGIYALCVPPYAPVSSVSSATVTTSFASGATVQVQVPLGAFNASTALQVAIPTLSSVPSLPNGLLGTGLTISVNTSDGQQPALPIPITLGYTALDIAGLNPDHLRLARYDVSTGWVILPSAVDTSAQQVSGTTDHFSLFQIVAASPGDLSLGIVFPNPFRPALGHTKIKFANLPAAAHVKIYTVTGRLLKELDADTVGQVLTWDGTDKDGKVLPSGVYVAYIQASGNSKTLKFAVQR